MGAIRGKRLRALAGFVLVGGGIGTVVGLVIAQIDLGAPWPHLIRGAIAGLLMGGLVGATEEIFFVGAGRRLNYYGVNALRLVHYTVSVTATLVLVNSGYASLVGGADFRAAVLAYVFGDTALRDVLFTFVVAVIGTSWLEIRRLHNPGDLRRFLLGRYRQPEEESRVLLFTDLEDSTGLAEKLGNLRYSQMLADCFYHMSEAILAWRGQVYQYVGDQMVITWPYEEGVDEATCVRCFFDMVDSLESRSERFRTTYGAVPRFRAGIHGGPVVTTWVGEAKKELAFHGDALNVTARIQGHCRPLDAVCLVSNTLLAELGSIDGLEVRSVGRVELRGRSEALEVSAITKSLV